MRAILAAGMTGKPARAAVEASPGPLPGLAYGGLATTEVEESSPYSILSAAFRRSSAVRPRACLYSFYEEVGERVRAE